MSNSHKKSSIRAAVVSCLALAVSPAQAEPVDAQHATIALGAVRAAVPLEQRAAFDQRMHSRTASSLRGIFPPKVATEVSQDIELRSPDGLVSLEGVILHFDESLITIKTSFGVVGVETFGLECFGAACPPELTPDS